MRQSKAETRSSPLTVSLAHTLAPRGEVEDLLDGHLAVVDVVLADVRRRLLRHELVQPVAVVGYLPADLKSGVQLAGQGQQERRLAGRRWAEQQRHPGRAHDAGDVLEDVERLPLAELDPDASQQRVGHVQRDVRQRGQRAGADVALRLHVDAPEPHLHRGDLDTGAVDARAELPEEALVVLIGDPEHALHEGLALREPHRAHVHLLMRVPAPPAAAAAVAAAVGSVRRPHEARAQALEGRQPLHRGPLQRLLVVHLGGAAAAPRRRAREVGGGVGARHAVQASAQRLHACCAGSDEPCMHCTYARPRFAGLLELTRRAASALVYVRFCGELEILYGAAFYTRV
jgi:hypothetical protein